jgi:prepilin-type N-terminal cleavage/methylation domain-containing protein
MGARSTDGFTLVELLVATALMLMVLGAVYTLYRVQTHSTKVEASRLEAQEYANAVLDLMVREIRNAGACSGGIISAAKQNLRIAYDANGDNDCGDSNEDITFAFDATGCAAGYGNITRMTVVPSQSQPLTDCNVPTGAGNFSFNYYPQQTSGSAPPPFCISTGDPAGCSGTLDVNAVQRITISVIVHAMNPDAQFGGQLSATMTSNVDLRNRGSSS